MKKSIGRTAGLPFNTAILGADFTILKPGVELPDMPGFWALLQGNTLVVLETGEGNALPEGELPAWADSGKEPVCVGLWHGRLLRALEVGVTAVIPAVVDAAGRLVLGR